MSYCFSSSSGKYCANSMGMYDLPVEEGALKLTLNCDYSVYAVSIERNVMSLLILSNAECLPLEKV